MTNEMIQKAKECKSAEELLALAKENGVEMTAEEAEAYLAELGTEGEMSDDELENAAGGGCHNKEGRLVVTTKHSCDFWAHKQCGKGAQGCKCIGGYDHGCYMPVERCCETCKYCTYEKALWLCNHEANVK